MKTVKQRKTTRHKISTSVLAVVLLVAASVAVLVVLLPNLPKKQQSVPPQHYRGVVELWNVQSFEGGSGSRSAWLTSRAAKFEQSNTGLFVHVTDLTVQQMQQKLDCGENFDILCFSRGAGYLVQNLLQPYTGSVADLRENLLLSGQVGNSVYALPLYCGAYCLFARRQQLPQNCDLLQTALSNTYTRKIGKTQLQLQPLVCGFTQFNSPLSALALSGGRGKAVVDTSLSQYAAYESFVGNKTAVTLLGTQRDIYRLGKREESGKLEQLEFCPLAGYTDLVQYLGVSATCGDKTQSCMQFLQYLVGKDSQQTLTSVNMFSVLDESFYTSERFALCEQGLAQSYVPNVFGDMQAIDSQRQAAVATLGM